MTAVALEARGLVKAFGDLVAVGGVDLDVNCGRIHAVMGENGAGKSTLMSMLFGLLRPDAGEIRLGGAVVRFRGPADAIAAGLGMVHQAFRLFDEMKVWENVVAAAEPRRGPFVDVKSARTRVAELAETFGLAVNPDAKVGDLSVGARQRVEILKALHRGAKILILDEPTAVLTPIERNGLFHVLRRLADEGCATLFVTHKLDEVLAISDDVLVMRDGKAVKRLLTREADAATIVRAMTGRDLKSRTRPAPAKAQASLLQVRGLRVAGADGREAVHGVDLDVRGGEIVGVAGVAGNGQSELVCAIVGLKQATAGEVRIADVTVDRLDVADRRAAGLAYIPEDRARTGTAGTASAAENLAMGAHRRSPLAERGFLARSAIAAQARDLIKRFSIKIADESSSVGPLSGGNLQKIVVARELSRAAAVLVAEQPTRGVDVGAIEFIHDALLAERAAGRAILLISSELSEVFALADRILVMFEGRIVARLAGADADEATVGAAMAGRSATAV